MKLVLQAQVDKALKRFLFPQALSSILEKRDWTRWWACCAVLGVGFGCAGRAGAGAWAWFGSGGRAGLGCADLAFCVRSTLYTSSSCLHDVIVFIFMCISDVYHGA